MSFPQFDVAECPLCGTSLRSNPIDRQNVYLRENDGNLLFVLRYWCPTKNCRVKWVHREWRVSVPTEGWECRDGITTESNPSAGSWMRANPCIPDNGGGRS